MRTMRECPECGEWLELLATTPMQFGCPCCRRPMVLAACCDEGGNERIEVRVSEDFLKWLQNH